LGTGKSRVEMLEGLGFRTRIAPKLSVEDGIEAVRRMIPRTWIDEKRCDAGLRAIRDYREKRDEKRRLGVGPLHDWTSHAADAIRYLAVSWSEPQLKREAARRPVHAGVNTWMGR